jgi:hypothetical protein
LPQTRFSPDRLSELLAACKYREVDLRVTTEAHLNMAPVGRVAPP